MSDHETLWLPSNYVDEVMPEGKASPQDWVELINGLPHIVAPFDDEETETTWPLTEGDVITFQRHTRLPDIVVKMNLDGGFTTDRDPHLSANCFGSSELEQFGQESLESLLEEIKVNYGLIVDPIEVWQFEIVSQDYRFVAGQLVAVQ